MSVYREDYDVYLSKDEAIDILQELSKWVRVYNPICHPRKMGAVMDMAIKALKGQAADVEPVVHCKDCKHKPHTKEPDGDGYGFDITADGDFTCPFLCDDGYYNRMPSDDFYCSYGKRKDSGR